MSDILSYEVHVTFVGQGIPRAPDGWKHSAITGDPLLGPGPRQYLTRHYPKATPFAKIRADFKDATDYLTRLGFMVVRRKVEAIVYDEVFR